MRLFSLRKNNPVKGDTLPGLVLYDDLGEPFDTQELKNKWHVLYFYPKDNTRGCTKQGMSFSTLLPQFRKAGAEVIGISTDNLQSHQNFKKNHNLSQTLLSDPGGKLAQALGVRIFFGMCTRDCVVINPEGKIDSIFRGVSPGKSPNEILAYLQEQTNPKL